MFRRARLSVKPNVRPGVGARGSTAPNPHRGRESPRPPEPRAESAPKPVEPTDVPAVDSGGAEPQEKAPRSSDEKIGTENNVEESSKLSSTVSQRRKRISSTSSFVKPSVSLPSQSHPLSAVNQDAPQPNPIPTKEKQPCSDRYRIYKAQKLREMLKEELRKEKKQWKNKYAINESQRPPDRSKMTMRDFIYYLPDNNPMTSSLEQEKKTEKLLAPVQSRDRQENKSTVDVEDNEEMEEETDDGPLLVPRVKVAEDGSIILDEESLTVEVLRTKGPCVVEENDPIFERGSTTTYSSFRKNYYSKPWSNKETDMFFLAISMVGTDFSMIGQLFPHRARIEIKNKFKREEKTNGWRIDKAFQEKRPFDFDFFAHLLQKVLAEEEKRKQKSIKSQSLKEKKSSKPRKNVKVKKVASEGVNDDPDESLSTKISDAQEDAQTVEESLTLPEQDLEQVALEQDQSEKKRRRKNQDDANEQEVKNLLGNASVHSAPLKGEKHKNKSLSSRPEVNDGECNMEQKLLYAQSRDDSVSLASGEKVEKRADPVLSESNQQDTIPLAAESSELSTSDLPPSKVGIRTSCDVNNAESNTGEISFDLKNKSLETDQVENVKPVLRSRLQKPKPNLSRAVGKKSILSQNKTDAESKSVCSETSVEKNHVEKNKVNTGDCFEMENTERENLEAESVSNLNEKTCLQEDNQPKAFRPSRPLRGRLLRPRPNIGKAEARKEILESQEEIGTDIENNENESCVDRDIPQQMEDQSCKNFRSKVSHVTSERKDSSFQKVQPDEPKTLKECLSIQEDKQANVIKQVPVSRTRFQKPKPNIGRRREVSSKEVPEEILTSGEKIAALREIVRLDTLPREKVSVTTTTAKEMKSDLKETGRDISLSEKMPEMTDITVEMQTGLKAIEREISPRGMISEMTDSTVQKETDLRTPGREISPREKVQELTVAIEEIDRNVEETEIREIVPQQNVQEIKSVGDMETDLKKTGREMPTQDRTPQKINVTEERETDLEETEGREISALIKVSEEVRTIDELKTDLKEMREEISQREKVLVKVSVVGERKIVLKETGRDISLMKNISGEMSTIKGMETDLKDTGRDISLMETISEKMTAIEGIEADLKDTGRDIALMETISGEMTAIEGTEADLKDTGRDISLMQTTSGEMITTEGVETDLKNTGRNISLMETTSEEMTAIEGMEAYLKDTGRDISLMETISGEMITTEGVEANLKDTERDIALMETISGKMTAIEGMETDLKDTGRDIALMETISEEMIATEGMEADLKDTGRDISLMETISGGMITTKGVEADLNDTGRDIALMGTISGGMITTEGVEADLKDTGRDISLMETISGEMITTEGVEADLNDTGRDIAPMETISGEMIATEGVEADLKDTGRKNSLRKRGSVKIGVTEEMVADLEKTGKTDISPRENESEEPSKQTKANVMQSSSVDIITIPSLDMKTISSEVLSVMHIPTEENKNSEKEVSCHLSHLKTSSQTSELGETEDQGIRLPDVPEQFSDISLSKSLPQEQKPLEVKPAPFVRSQLKRPKPNLTRAALKKETTEAQKYAPGKKLETEEAETIVIQQDGEQASTFTSQPDMASLVPSKEKDKSSHKEEVMTLPCIQTEKDPSSSNSYEPKEESQTAQTQENELVVSIGTPEINPFPQEVKESAIQTSGPVRGRLQRPKPNVRKARHRQIVENDEAKGIIKEERAILQKNESNKKSLTVSNSQIETEIEVVPSKVSECRMNENQNPMVLVENLHVNERNVLDEKMRLENKPYIPSPAQSIRRKFQKTKPNLGRAHSKKEEPGIEKGTYRSKTSKPEDNLQQQGNSDIHFFPKEKTETLSSVEVTARKYFVGCRESSLAKKNAQLEEVGPSVSAGEENIGTNSVSSVVEEQYLSKVTSHPQLLKESNSSKISLDRRTTITTASVCEIDHSERRVHRKIKPNVTKGRGSKRTRGKTSKKEPRASKSMLVTLRASQEEEEDDAEDFESDYEEENYHLAPEELNKAPVFVPIGLRSPEPVSAQIEETMEELEITENVADIGCVTVVEHQLSNTDIATQEVKEEKNLNTSSFEITAGEQTQDEPGTNDGSTEAAITLLTMGDLVLQSEISTEQGDVGVCVFPDVQSEDKSHIPFSPANVNDKIVHEYQELSSPIISTPPASFEENKIVLEEQSTREVGLMQEVKENATLTRNTTSKVTNNMRMRSRFIKPKPNLEKILRTKRFHVNQKDPSFCVLKGEEVEIPRETETNASKATELEEKRLGQIITTESKEQNQLSCVHDIKGTTISQEPNFTERNEDQEERSQEVTPVVSSEQGPHTFDSGRGLGESSFEEPLIKDTKGDSVLTFLVPECIPTSIPEVQQENVINPEDLTVNLFADVHQDGEDEQAFILTLVEIPTNATEEFADATSQLMPNPLLPAPILVKSVNTEEIGDLSKSAPLTSVGQDAMCLTNSARDDSEEPPANLDLISRKRFHCRLDESNHVPPAKKSSLTSRDDCQQYTPEVCSKKLNVFEETGESYKGRGIFPTSGCTHATAEPQKEKLETTFQNVGSRSVDKIRDTYVEKNMPQLTQDEMVVSDKEKRTDSASTSEQMGSRTASSKTPLSRPGRRPLGFLSLICSKNNLESDEPTHVHSKKRLKPLIPVSRRNLKRSNPLNEDQKKNQESSDLLPSPSVVTNTQSENIGSSSAQVSCDQPLLKEERKTGQNRAPEQEPTSVSEYFFSDIFIEVDETE